MTPPTAAELERRIAAAAHPEAQSFGARFVSSPTYRALRDKGYLLTEDERARTSLANTDEIVRGLRLRTFADLNVFSAEGVPHPGLVPSVARVPDYVETIPTTKQQVLLGTETSETLGAVAAGVAEQALLPEPAMSAPGPPQQVTLPRFGLAWPVSRGVLDDPGVMQSLLNSRLTLGVRQGLERQVLVGAAADVAGVGLTNVTGTNAVTRGSTQLRYQALAQGVSVVQGLGWYVNPLVVVAHPTALYNARTELSASLPVAAALREALPEVEAVLPSRLLPAGTAIVGDFLAGVALFVRGPLSIEVSREHSQWLVGGVQQPWGTAGTPQTTINFDTSGLVEFIAWMRAYSWIRRPDAFAVVSNL